MWEGGGKRKWRRWEKGVCWAAIGRVFNLLFCDVWKEAAVVAEHCRHSAPEIIFKKREKKNQLLTPTAELL